MSPWPFLGRVTREAAVAVLALALVATPLFGRAAGIGVLAGGLLGMGNLWWLTAGAMTALGGRGRWPVAAGLRLAAVAVIAALVFKTGLAHPVALVVGFTVLPCALIARGLRTVGTETGTEH